MSVRHSVHPFAFYTKRLAYPGAQDKHTLLCFDNTMMHLNICICTYPSSYNIPMAWTFECINTICWLKMYMRALSSYQQYLSCQVQALTTSGPTSS